jgi:hypothetical protein
MLHIRLNLCLFSFLTLLEIEPRALSMLSRDSTITSTDLYLLKSSTLSSVSYKCGVYTSMSLLILLPEIKMLFL